MLHCYNNFSWHGIEFGLRRQSATNNHNGHSLHWLTEQLVTDYATLLVYVLVFHVLFFCIIILLDTWLMHIWSPVQSSSQILTAFRMENGRNVKWKKYEVNSNNRIMYCFTNLDPDFSLCKQYISHSIWVEATLQVEVKKIW